MSDGDDDGGGGGGGSRVQSAGRHVCTGCRRELLATAFRGGWGTNHNYRCRTCVGERQQKYRELRKKEAEDAAEAAALRVMGAFVPTDPAAAAAAAAAAAVAAATAMAEGPRKRGRPLVVHKDATYLRAKAMKIARRKKWLLPMITIDGIDALLSAANGHSQLSGQQLDHITATSLIPRDGARPMACPDNCLAVTNTEARRWRMAWTRDQQQAGGGGGDDGGGGDADESAAVKPCSGPDDDDDDDDGSCTPCSDTDGEYNMPHGEWRPRAYKRDAAAFSAAAAAIISSTGAAAAADKRRREEDDGGGGGGGGATEDIAAAAVVVAATGPSSPPVLPPVSSPLRLGAVSSPHTVAVPDASPPQPRPPSRETLKEAMLHASRALARVADLLE